MCALIGEQGWETWLAARSGVKRRIVMMFDVCGDSSLLDEAHCHKHTHTLSLTHTHTHSDVVVGSVKQDELRLDLDCVISIKRKQSCVQVGSSYCIKHCFIKIMPSSSSLSFSPCLSACPFLDVGILLCVFMLYVCVCESVCERNRDWCWQRPW